MIWHYLNKNKIGYIFHPEQPIQLIKDMKQLLIILFAISLAFVCSDSFGQTHRKSKSSKGYNYAGHAKRNAKLSKSSAKKWKASQGNATAFNCGRKSPARRKR